MREGQRKDNLERLQKFCLAFTMMTKSPGDFYDLVKKEFGYMWDGRG